MIAEPPRGKAGMLAETFWVRLPRAVSRAWFTLGLALRDGDFLRAWPQAAAFAPLVAGLIGAGVGIFHTDPAYSTSLATLVVLVALGNLAAGVGAWAFAGYVVADFLANDHSMGISLYGTTWADRIWKVQVALWISYVLLAVVMVTIPFVASGLRLQMVRAVHATGPTAIAVGVLVQAGVQGSAVGLWSQAAAFLIRPLWSFIGQTPPISAIAPLQGHARLLGAVAAVAGAARVVATGIGSRRHAPMPAALAARRARQTPWWLRAAARALVLTVVISGLLSGTPQGIVVFAVLLAAAAVQSHFIPNHLRAVATRIRRIPLVVRLALAGAAAFALSGLIVDPAVRRGEDSFTSMIAALVISFAFAATLFPAAPSQPTGNKP